MVDSLSLKIQVKTDADESEVLACIAAVTFYCQTEEEDKARRSKNSSNSANGLSAWRQASLLEGTTTSQSVVSKPGNRRLWRNFLSLLAATLTLNLVGFNSGRAAAQEYEPENQDGQLLASSPFNALANSQSPATDNQAPIRVALALNVADVAVDTLDGARIVDMASGRTVAQVQALSQWRFAAATSGGAAALSLIGRRDVDRCLISLGDRSVAREQNVAFAPMAFSGPPNLKSLETAMAALPRTAKTQPLLIQCSSPVPGGKMQTGTPASQAPPLAPSFRGERSETPEPGSQPDEGSASIDLSPFQACGITSGVMVLPEQNAQDGSKYVFSLNGKMYRGALWLRPAPVKDKDGRSVSRFTAINVLDLEDYLMSVLPSEMPSSWPLEALKAQAIAARSYAIANRGKYNSQGFDVKATVLDQAYRGVVAETWQTNRAVAETVGIVMMHQGKVVPGFFHASSSGPTDLAEHVWTRGLPYLKAVPDFDHKSKYVLWERKFPTSKVDSAWGKDVGDIIGMFAVNRSPSGRVKHLLVVGSKSSMIVDGATVRQVFGLPSTNFNVLPYQDSYVFKGQGFGHGLGMSQWGARSLAEHNYNAAQILTYYYKDVTFEHFAQ